LATVVVVAALLACGDSDVPTSSEEPPGAVAQPEPNEPIEAKVESLNAAVESEDCKRYVPLVYSFSRSGNRLGAPATDSECRVAERGVLRQLQGTRFEDSAELGTAALIEGEGGDGATNTTVWVVDRDGEFRIANATTGQAQIGSEPPPDVDPTQAAESFIDAAVDDDCDALQDLLNPGARVLQDVERSEDACDTVLDGPVFAPAIRETPDARPVELAATANLAFYGIPTEDAYFTLLLSSADEPSEEMTVIDILPNTPVSLPEAENG
jgi:hypothetical protein